MTKCSIAAAQNTNVLMNSAAWEAFEAATPSWYRPICTNRNNPSSVTHGQPPAGGSSRSPRTRQKGTMNAEAIANRTVAVNSGGRLWVEKRIAVGVPPHRTASTTHSRAARTGRGREDGPDGPGPSAAGG